MYFIGQYNGWSTGIEEILKIGFDAAIRNGQ
jgi:hypothetical protein